MRRLKSKMKKIYLFLALFSTIAIHVLSQDKAPDKPPKSKTDIKSIEALRQLNSDESDVLFKSDASNKLDAYLAELANKSKIDKVDSSLKTISQEIAKSYSIIDTLIIKSSKGKNDSFKKIQDLIDYKNNTISVFVPINNGDYLMRCGTSKQNAMVTVTVAEIDYALNEVSYDENWGVGLYAWDKKPAKIFTQVKFETCGAVGSLVFRVDKNGNIEPCLISNILTFNFREKNYRSFNLLSVKNIEDGDYIFNETGSLIGASFVHNGKSVIVDGLFINSIATELYKVLGVKSYIGVLGNFVDNGFKVKEVLNPESLIKPNDIIEEVDGVKISKDNIYSLKQSFKNKKKIDLKINRENKHDTIKGVVTVNFSTTYLKSRTLEEYKKLFLWIDPLDTQQLLESTKFIANCKQHDINNFDFKFYRVKEESLVDWVSTVKLIRFLYANKKENIFDWFLNNPYQENDEFSIKFCQKFNVKRETLDEVIANRTEEEKILEDYTDGMVKLKIATLPAISFSGGKGVSFNQDFESWVRSLFEENGF